MHDVVQTLNTFKQLTEEEVVMLLSTYDQQLPSDLFTQSNIIHM